MLTAPKSKISAWTLPLPATRSLKSPVVNPRSRILKIGRRLFFPGKRLHGRSRHERFQPIERHFVPDIEGEHRHDLPVVNFCHGYFSNPRVNPTTNLFHKI
jgi:hypothetical protein